MTCEVKVKEWSLAAVVGPSFQSGHWNETLMRTAALPAP